MKAIDVCNKTGLSGPLISQYLSGKFVAKNDKAYLLGKALHVNPSWLMGISDDMEMPIEMKEKVDDFSRIPLYSTICCGNGGFVDDEIMDYISLPPEKLNPHKEYFAQVASGNSMINAGIHPGDILVFEKTSSVDDGDIGCFCIDDNEAMCKRYRLRKDKDGHIVQIVLVPDNPDVVKYPPVVIDVETQHFRTIGKLVYCIMDMKGR